MPARIKCTRPGGRVYIQDAGFLLFSVSVALKVANETKRACF